MCYAVFFSQKLCRMKYFVTFCCHVFVLFWFVLQIFSTINLNFHIKYSMSTHRRHMPPNSRLSITNNLLYLIEFLYQGPCIYSTLSTCLFSILILLHWSQLIWHSSSSECPHIYMINVLIIFVNFTNY